MTSSSEKLYLIVQSLILAVAFTLFVSEAISGGWGGTNTINYFLLILTFIFGYFLYSLFVSIKTKARFFILLFLIAFALVSYAFYSFFSLSKLSIIFTPMIGINLIIILLNEYKFAKGYSKDTEYKNEMARYHGPDKIYVVLFAVILIFSIAAAVEMRPRNKSIPNNAMTDILILAAILPSPLLLLLRVHLNLWFAGISIAPLDRFINEHIWEKFNR